MTNDRQMLMPLAALRKLTGMSQLELAKELGVNNSTVGHWEGGIRIPSLPVAAKYAALLGVSLDHLYGALERNGNDTSRGRHKRRSLTQEEN